MLNVFQTCLKGFKLKNMVVELKTTQLIEGLAQLVEGCKNIIFLPKRLLDPLRFNLIWPSTSCGAIEVQQSLVMH